MSNNRVYFIMVLAALFWSGAFITGKMAVLQFPAFALTFWRFFFALPFIFLILYIRQPGNWLPKKEEWPPLIFLGIQGTFLYHGLFFLSLKYTTAINSSLIGSTNPMVTALLAILLFHEKFTPSRAAGILLSFLGVFLTVTNGNWSEVARLHFNTGDIIMFVAVWCFAFYSLFSRRIMQKYQLSPLTVTAYTFLVCTIVSIPFVLWEKPMTYLPYTTTGGWLSILYMSIFASVLGYLFQLTAIQKIGAPKTAIFINLVPVFTIVFSILILGETFSWFKFMSACMIITGVYITSRPESNASKRVTNSPEALSTSNR
ncbi:MAG: DMT family transporter [Bacillota bacterium]|nr:DMT family transporter [Bacillota bacterium]